MAVYTEIFSDETVFGNWSDYNYNHSIPEGMEPMVGLDMDPDIAEVGMGFRSRTVYQATEVVNLRALEARHQLGPAESGERRPEGLQEWIAFHQQNGQPVPHDADKCYSQAVRAFNQVDGLGRAYQVGSGVQNGTRESRPVAFEGMPVAELDQICANFQHLVLALAETLPMANIEKTYEVLLKVRSNMATWKEGVAAYYGITPEQAKTMLNRMIFFGSIQPDPDWESPRTCDVLPCLLELRFCIHMAVKHFQSCSAKFQRIASMPKVTDAPNPMASALSFLLQDAENKCLNVMAVAASEAGATILSYVFDGLYILADNDQQLSDIFDAVAPRVHSQSGVYIALKTVSGEVIKKYVESEGARSAARGPSS